MVVTRIVRSLDRLLSVPSKTGELSKEVIEVAQNELQLCGITSDVVSYENAKKGTIYYSLIAHRDAGKQNTNVLVGHLDVVDVSDEGQWTPYKKDGCIVGRGTADAKGPAAAALHAFASVPLEQLEKNTSLVLTTDEEIGGYHGAKPILEDLNLGNDDFVIALEPRCGTITTKHFGVLRFSVTAKNDTSHVKTGGANTVRTYQRFLEELDRYVGQLGADPDLGPSIVSPVYINKTGSLETLGQNPGYLEAGFDIRLQPHLNVTQVYDNILGIAARLGVQASFIVDAPPLNTDPNNSDVQHLLNHGYTLKAERGSTDAKWATCPAVVFGPEGVDLHGPNERVLVKGLERAYKDLTSFLQGT